MNRRHQRTARLSSHSWGPQQKTEHGLRAKTRTGGESGHGCPYGDGARALTGLDGITGDCPRSGRPDPVSVGAGPRACLSSGQPRGDCPYSQRTEDNPLALLARAPAQGQETGGNRRSSHAHRDGRAQRCRRQAGPPIARGLKGAGVRPSRVVGGFCPPTAHGGWTPDWTPGLDPGRSKRGGDSRRSFVSRGTKIPRWSVHLVLPVAAQPAVR